MASGRLSSAALLCVCSVLLVVVADVAAAHTESPRNQHGDHSSFKTSRKHLRSDHRHGEWGCAWKVIAGFFERGEAATESVESAVEQVVSAAATATATESTLGRAASSEQAGDETAAESSFARRELTDYGTTSSGANCSGNCKK